MSVAERVAGLEARAAIADLPGRYAAAFANFDLDALVGLYAPNVELSSGERGRAALRAYFAAGIHDGALHTVVLHTGDHVIDVTGPDTAEGAVYCHVEVLLADGSGYQQAVLYTDRYRRSDGIWCFATQRRHELFYGAPWLARPNGLPEAHWPRSQTGRGTLPYRWPSWQDFWADLGPDEHRAGRR
jgi:ketosteroid isomerase-like protein